MSLFWVFSCDMFTRIAVADVLPDGTAVLTLNSTDNTLDCAYGGHPPALVRHTRPLTLEQDNCTRFIAELLSPLKT